MGPMRHTTAGGVCAPAEVEEQLHRIIRSGELQLPQRAVAMLEFLVAETLAGRGTYLKAFTIASKVFRRGPDFDPQNDPTVRIEAARLRRGLERYYLVCGSDDPILITIPKGQYRPVFLPNAVPDEPAAECPIELDRDNHSPLRRRLVDVLSRTDKRGCYMAVFVGATLPAAMVAIGLLDGLGTSSQDREPPGLGPNVIVGSFSEGVIPFGDQPASPADFDFRDMMIFHLVRGRDLTVFLKEADEGKSDTEWFVLNGAVRQLDETVRVSAKLIRRSDGVVVWAGSDSYVINDPAKTADQISGTFASGIARRLVRGAEEPYQEVLARR